MNLKVEVIKPFLESQLDKSHDELLLNHFEVCAYLGIAKRKLRLLRKSGALDFTRIHQHCYYTIGTIKAFQRNELRKNLTFKDKAL